MTTDRPIDARAGVHTTGGRSGFAWDLGHENDAGWKHDADWIAEYAVEWLKREARAPHRRAPCTRTFAWKVSYASGLLLTEQLRGRLGLPALDDAQIAALVPGEKTVDREPFLAGVADMNQVEMTPAGLQRLLESDALRVEKESLPLLFHALGRDALPFPWR